jgi:O-antigen biosynthesis protein
MNPLYKELTLVIPTYNGSAFLDKTLDSVAQHGAGVGQVIVIDDASSDNTVQIVERAFTDFPIRSQLIRMEKNSGGPARPLTRGFRAAKLPFVAMLEQDDLVRPGRFLAHLDAANRFPDSVASFGRVDRVNADGSHGLTADGVDNETHWTSGVGDSEHLLISTEEMLGRLLHVNPILTNSNFAIKTEAAIAAESRARYLYRVAGDWYMNYRVALQGPIVWINRILTTFQRHNESLSTSRLWEAEIEAAAIRLRIALQEKLYNEAELGQYYWRLQREVETALRSRQFGKAIKISRLILASGIVGKRIGDQIRKTGLGRQATQSL